MVKLLRVLLFAPKPVPKLLSQTTEEDAVVLVLEMTREFPPVFKPLMLTLSAPFNLMIAPAIFPVMV
jgi:hypothetical protein